ncbi:hypothetical protein EG329_014161 [Mollisiaceae sp. DMI_Dod_QoI]|nr:hypothetical protein EG329_014161 [Helotiales sp. DMI_Dod_QoI]
MVARELDRGVAEYNEAANNLWTLLTLRSFNWSPWMRWRLTISVLIASILFGLPAGAYGAGNDRMPRVFNVSNDGFPYLYFATTSWDIGAALFPLLFIPLTETSGRMPGYFRAYIVSLIFLATCSAIRNFQTMVVCRFFGEGASSVAINIVGGSISDVWKGAEQRSLPIALFGATSVIGIALDHSLEEPSRPIFLLALRSSKFSSNYGFTSFEMHLIQLALSAGAVAATIINPILDHQYLASTKKSKDVKPIPEARLYSSVLGSLLFTAGLFWYGWANYPHVLWVVPMLGTGFVGLGIYSIYLAVVNNLADSYEKYGASALSAASFRWNTFGAFLPLTSPALYTDLGLQ